MTLREPYNKHPSSLKEVQQQKPAPFSLLKEGARRAPKTSITIWYDAGYPNALYLRGQGANLSWEKGIEMKNIRSNQWVWETTEPFTSCEFKVLINDKEYEIGNNHILTCGASIQYTPHF